MLFSALLFAIVAGCASQQKITKQPIPVAIDTSRLEIQQLEHWLAERSKICQRLNVEGDITVDQEGETNSASFDMKSKRLDASGNRIDSLSIVVSGPLGIKLARFLASPERYQFYDMLHGQTLSGRTDATSLEELTHLSGVSLPIMSDIIYGLPGMNLEGDSIRLYSTSSDRYVLIDQNPNLNITYLLQFEGALTANSVNGTFYLSHLDRWNQILDPMSSKVPTPFISIHFSEPESVSGVFIPKKIEAVNGNNSLTLQYNTVELNPNSLKVKIKMPE